MEEKASQEQRASIQTRAMEPVTEGGGFNFLMLAQTGNLAPAWWSTGRDEYLMRHWPECPLFAGAAYNIAAKLATVPPLIEPRDPTMKSHRDLAEQYSIQLYEGSEFGRGWIEFAMKWHIDRWTQDNGAIGEVIGDGPKSGPIHGPALGLANLDASRCTRTGNPEFPIVYTRAGDGKKFKLHHSRVIYGSQMPSTRDDMHGVGLCWYSRCMLSAQGIVDDITYKAEKLGSRPKRAILVGKKMSIDMVSNAFRMADEAGDNASLTRMSVLPVVANPDAADVGIDLVDLASLPDGFDWKEDANVAMYIIALTGGFPVRWLWPATVVGATKADAMIQHMVGAMSGTAHELGTLALLLGGSERGMTHQAGKFLPPSLKIRFDVTDDWIDDIQAGIKRVRAESRERDLLDGAVTIRVTREHMLQAGEITEAQFRQMELEDGRTQDGLPVDTLFYGDNPFLQGIDPDKATETEINEKLVAAKKASIRDTNQKTKEQAREAVAALEWLLEPEEEEVEGTAPQQEDRAPTAGNLPSSANPGSTDEMDKSKERQEVQMSRAVRKVFDEFEPECADALASGEEPDYSRLRKLLEAVLLVWLIRSFMDGVDELEKRYDVAFDPGDAAAAANLWAVGHLPVLLGQLIGTTQKVVSTIPTEGLNAEEIRGLLGPAFSRARAELITITEITKAMTGAFMWYQEQLQIMGYKVNAIWETARDELVCDLCAPLDGQPKEVWMTASASGPPLHGRCRCGLRLEIERIQNAV